MVLAIAAYDGAAQSAPALPPGVQDVVKLVKAGLGEEVVLTHVRNTGATYILSADQLIYLHEQGVTQSEITALMGSGGAGAAPSPAPAPVAAPPAASPAPVPAVPAPAPVAPPATYAPAPTAPVAAYAPTPAPPPAQYVPAPAPAAPAVAPVVAAAPVPSLDAFRAQLAPYGTWTDIPGYGLCWRPAVSATDPYWRPYCDQGRWIYTADGWCWQSDYPWGDLVFHYGRWFQDAWGWVWVPGYDWAPAWVCWRQADGYCGWAPLPPGAVFRAGVGLWYNGRLAVDVDFGLGAAMFTFVPYDHFWDHNFHAYLLPRDRVVVVFGHSVVMNGYRFEHGRFFVGGIGRDRMVVLTHHDIRVEESFHGGARVRVEAEHGGFHDDHHDRHDRW